METGHAHICHLVMCAIGSLLLLARLQAASLCSKLLLPSSLLMCLGNQQWHKEEAQDGIAMSCEAQYRPVRCGLVLICRRFAIWHLAL